MDETRVFGYCENCGSQVTDTDDFYYVNEDGQVFCCVECVCEHYGVSQREV